MEGYSEEGSGPEALRQGKTVCYHNTLAARPFPRIPRARPWESCALNSGRSFSLTVFRPIQYLVDGVLFAAGALAFVFNMWVTFNKADARQRERIVAALREKGLPTADQ